MKRSLSISLFTVLIMLYIPARAQYILNEADEQYRLFNYIKSIDLYEQAYKKKQTLYAAERLANAYSLTRNYPQAESWYAITSNMPGSKSENVLGYARSLVGNSKYAEAREQFKKYIELNGNVPQRQKDLWLQSCDSAAKWMQNPVAIKMQNAKELNTPQSDWGAVKNNAGITFTSDRKNVYEYAIKGNKPFLKFDAGKTPDKNSYGWTGNHYLKLYQKEDSADSLHLFPFSAGTAYHVGAASFSSNGNEMYFTLTRIPERLDFGKEKLATVNTEIYSSSKSVDGLSWEKPMPFKYNDPNKYSVGDPFLSKDGKTLYFVSNMPEGKGGTDLYVTVKNASDEWSAPVNLSGLNTENDERSPFLDDSGSFYFSSDGYIGLGGLDIFKSIKVGNTFSNPVNLGYPVNSPQDDFAFNMNTVTTGYLSSNRKDGLGEDDIYAFTRQQIIQALKLEGRVFNKSTGLPLPAAITTLRAQGGNILKVQTNDHGYYSFKIDKDIPYDLVAEKTTFQSADTSFVTETSLVKDFYLIPIEINKAIRLENIYYDFDKWNIRRDAALELDKLVKILKDNPTIWIELGSHTDSRGNDAYNMTLSRKRAESAVQYIISRGIDKNRITAQGYGESQLLNRCSNGVKCTEAEHQWNRRTEFKIVKQ